LTLIPVDDFDEKRPLVGVEGCIFPRDFRMFAGLQKINFMEMELP
jgi:hypothetical protein